MRDCKYIILLIIVMLISSCKFSVQQPTIKRLHDFKVLSFNPDTFELLISLEISNPNPKSMRISDLNVEIMDKNRLRLGKVTQVNTIEIPRYSSNNIEFKATLETRKAIKTISSTSQSLFVYILGEGNASYGHYKKHFDFEESYQFNFKDILEQILPHFNANGQDLLKIKKMSVNKVGLTESELRVDFILLNPYGFTFTVKDFPCEIYLNNKLTGKGNLASPLSFHEEVFSQEGQFVFTLGNFVSFLAALKSMLNAEMNYLVQGNVKINAYGMALQNPYQIKGKYPINLTDFIH